MEQPPNAATPASGLSDSNAGLAALRSHMPITYGFTRAHVAIGLMRKSGEPRVTSSHLGRAGRLIARAKKAGEIKCVSTRSPDRGALLPICSAQREVDTKKQYKMIMAGFYTR